MWNLLIPVQYVRLVSQNFGSVYRQDKIDTPFMYAYLIEIHNVTKLGLHCTGVL